MNHSLNSLKGVIWGIVFGDYKGDTRSLDYSSNEGDVDQAPGLELSLSWVVTAATTCLNVAYPGVHGDGAGGRGLCNKGVLVTSTPEIRTVVKSCDYHRVPILGGWSFQRSSHYYRGSVLELDRHSSRDPHLHPLRKFSSEEM